MSRRSVWHRVTRLEAILETRKPVEPCPVMVPLHLAGTPGALAQEQAFRAAHPGPVVLPQLVDARRRETA